MEKLKLLLDFLKWGFYAVMFYFLCQMIIATAVYIVGILALALIIDAFKKDKPKKENKLGIEQFKNFLAKQNAK